MSDEPEHDDNYVEGRAFLVESDKDFEYAIDCLLEVPVTRGEHLPRWSAEHVICPNGCCRNTIVTDEANDQEYLVANMPTIVVQMTTAMGGELPNVERLAITRRQSALN